MGPVIGVLADRSKSKYGRRRPFMIGGALVVAMGLLVLGWTAEIVGFFIPESELVSGFRRSRINFPLTWISETHAHNNLGCSKYLSGGLCYQCE